MIIALPVLIPILSLLYVMLLFVAILWQIAMGLLRLIFFLISGVFRIIGRLLAWIFRL